MAKPGRVNHTQEKIFENIDRSFEYENRKKERKSIFEYENKYEVIVKSRNVYSVIGEVYKTLQKKDKVLFEQLRSYFTKNSKLLTIEEIFKKVEDKVEFVGEDDYGCRWTLYSPEDFNNLKI